MKTRVWLSKYGLQPTPALVFTAVVIWLLPMGTLWLALFIWLRKQVFRALGRPLIIARIH